MIKVLKRKFIFTAMVAVTILLVTMAMTVNIINYTSVRAQAERLLTALAEDYNRNPALYRREAVGPEIYIAEDLIQNDDEVFTEEPYSGLEGDSSGDSAGDTGAVPGDEIPERFDVYSPPEVSFGFMIREINLNDVAGAVYFTVAIDKNGDVKRVDVSRVPNFTIKDAEYLAIPLFYGTKSSGWTEEYRYITTEDEYGNYVYIFLNREADIANQLRLLAITGLVSLLLFFIMLVFVILMSNRIIKPIAHNLEKQKSFVTDASHEIKTPLAIIQANTEALELYNGENKWTTNIKEQIRRLTILLTNMLTLAKADEGISKVENTEIDLGKLIDELLEMFHEPAGKRQLNFRQDMEEGQIIHANRIQIIQMLSILLDNAVKYSKENTAIDIHLREKDRNIQLDMINVVDAFPECEPERLFDRFYRPESSRYGEQTGNGIGLSAARAIIESYGGSIQCSYADENQIVFTVIFRK